LIPVKGQWAKAIHASGELVAYLIRRGARDIDNHYRFLDGVLHVEIRSKDLVLSDEDLSRLRRRLIHPQQREIGEYYWGLAGGEHKGTELEVVGNATEVLSVESSPDEGTVILLRRRD
jgi:hypothetical protein